nr:hypothetical protein [Halobacterium bonnevillei]
MKLAVPTDFEILDALADGKRNNAVNLSYILDKNRAYINTRLPVLADYALVERVGPAPNSACTRSLRRARPPSRTARPTRATTRTSRRASKRLWSDLNGALALRGGGAARSLCSSIRCLSCRGGCAVIDSGPVVG